MFLFVAAPLAWPQPAAPGVDAAVNEALYRQANFLSLQKKLADAKATQDRNEMAAAAKLYDDCW
ncbi:MAG: hypothetical protein DME25_21090, partial [Verrucomicrobia bacterium]